jgi:hypothetical protein
VNCGHTKIGRLAGNTLLVICSISIAVLLGEILSRLTLEKIDYLKPDIIEHPVLVRTIAPRSGGHDDWGFRNNKVPTMVDIVAIGDSQTYGVDATAHDSWPSWLSRISGKSVYNMGLGGYGPLEYRFLLNEYAIKLTPKHVLFGLYFGNDLWNAYESSIGVNERITRDRPKKDAKFLSHFRNFLSKNSVLYQVVKNQADTFFHWLRVRKQTRLGSDNVFMVHSKLGETVLEPRRRIQVLDQAKPEIRIGLSETLKTLSSIKDDCASLHTDCTVVLIPTKESVYWPLVKDHLDEARYEITSRLVESEKMAHDKIVDFLKNNAIKFVDCLEAMRSAAIEAPLYPAVGGHPNADGYEVIARQVWKTLNED